MKVNLELIDGTILKDVILSTTNTNFSLGRISEKQFNEYLNGSNNKVMFFCGKYAQGGISSPKIIKSHEILQDEDDRITLICRCGKEYSYIPEVCKICGRVFINKN